MKINFNLVAGVALSAMSMLATAAPNPASQDWVLDQIRLTDAAWAELCPGMQSGAKCFPQCNGANAKACTHVLNVTRAADDAGLMGPIVPNGMAVIKLPVPNGANPIGPALFTPSGSGHYAACFLYSTSGRLIQPRCVSATGSAYQHFTVPASSALNPAVPYTQGSVNCTGLINAMWQNVFNIQNGKNLYMLCLGTAGVGGNTSGPVNPDLAAVW